MFNSAQPTESPKNIRVTAFQFAVTRVRTLGFTWVVGLRLASWWDDAVFQQGVLLMRPENGRTRSRWCAVKLNSEIPKSAKRRQRWVECDAAEAEHGSREFAR